MNNPFTYNVDSGKWSQIGLPVSVLLLSVLGGLLIITMGMKGGILWCLFPFISAIGLLFFRKPAYTLVAALILSFFISGLSRYIKFQWGLGIDVLLVGAIIGIFIKFFRKADGSILKNDLVIWSLVWMGYVGFQLFNPEARSTMAWAYAMRGVGLYQLMTILLVLWLFRHHKYLNPLLDLLITLSVLGAIWAMKQKFIGTDAAEDYWLWAENHHEEHILFGVLRAFSFYSDAGQFGASQAMFALLCGILALEPGPVNRRKVFYAVAFVLIFIGFAISGSRGALAIPAIGGVSYLIFCKNFKLLALGVFAMAFSFYMLKYTHIAHGNEQIRRMRTALDDNNPSLNARLRNQATFGRYLASRPFGGGIGSAGYWGNRFSPNTLLAVTPTDSYYVKIWAETGLVGLCLHVLMLGYFVGKGGVILWNLKNQFLRYRVMAMYCSLVGILFASYGNQVFSQMPTGMIMNFFIPLIFLAPKFESSLNHQNHLQ